MKKRHVVTAILILLASACDEPVTVVTDFLHPDGSVTRKIEMRNIKNNFKVTDFQVPFDTSWKIKDTLEISQKGDTTWIKTAEKLFSNVDGINASYKTDSGANKGFSRYAVLQKHFRWFSTVFRFSEKIDQQLDSGYMIEDFLNNEELSWFYSPGSLTGEKMAGADSLRYKQLNDTVNYKSERWIISNYIMIWVKEFKKLTAGKAEPGMISGLRTSEKAIIDLIQNSDNGTDSLDSDQFLLKKLLGSQNSEKFKSEADSAQKITDNIVLGNFKDYSLRIVMPGKLTGTNGYIDSNKVMLWPVRSEFFLVRPYEMWAESKVPNIWAWLVSGIFILFVLSGIVIRTIKKG